MPGEEAELEEGEVRFLAGAEVQVQVKKAAVLSLLAQQRRTIALEEDDHLSEGEEMVGAGGLSSAIAAKNWDTSRMTVLKVNQQVEEELMLLSQRMLRQHLKKQKMHQRHVKLWC